MKQTLTNIIRNYCKNLTPKAKSETTVYLFTINTKATRGGTHVLTFSQFVCALSYAEETFLESFYPVNAYMARKDEKIFEAKTYGDNPSVLVIAMEALAMTERKRRRILQRIRKAEKIFADVRDELVLLNEKRQAARLSLALRYTMLARWDLEDPL